jgi:DNA-binding NarL/FixJ family response regulator
MDLTILVVDDHDGFRACARRLLEGAGYQVVGEAADGASAITRARELHPQLALVDLYLPDVDGFEVAASLGTLDRGPAVILTSSHERADIEPLVPRSGARGFVPKDELSKETIEGLL